MKLRTTTNSIRIRVRKSELALLHKNQMVEETIQFPNGVLFRYNLAISKGLDAITATLVDNNLSIQLPVFEAINWIRTNQVGMESKIPLPDGNFLEVLVEKDFPCLDRPNEDKSDTFWELSPDTPDAC